jgi:hypothetical protein
MQEAVIHLDTGLCLGGPEPSSLKEARQLPACFFRRRMLLQSTANLCTR